MLSTNELAMVIKQMELRSSFNEVSWGYQTMDLSSLKPLTEARMFNLGDLKRI